MVHPLAKRAGFALCLAGLLLTLARITLDVSEAPASGGWRVHLSVPVPNGSAARLITLALPWDTASYRVYRQAISHPGVSALRNRPAGVEVRALHLRVDTARAGPLVAEFDLERSEESDAGTRRTRPTETAMQRLLEVREGLVDEADAAQAQALGESSATAEERLDAVLALAAAAPRPATATRTERLVALARLAGLPARNVLGIALEASVGAAERRWAEIYLATGWTAVDTGSVPHGRVPATWLPLSKGEGSIATLDGGPLPYRAEVQPLELPRATAGPLSALAILDLARLSSALRDMLALLLLLPFCALLNAAFRTYVGFRTFGIFSAPLLALAAAFGEPAVFTAIFVLVIGFGALGYVLLDRRHFDRFHRLTLMFTLVAVVLAFGTSGLAYAGFDSGALLVLLPIVILTNLVDRLYGVVEDEGIATALARLGWTLVVAAGCYLVLVQEAWGAWIVVHPEAHLVTMGGVLLLAGRRGHSLRRWLTNNGLLPERRTPAGTRRVEDAGE